MKGRTPVDQKLYDKCMELRTAVMGKAYVDREYAWETIDEKLEDILARTAPQAP